MHRVCAIALALLALTAPVGATDVRTSTTPGQGAAPALGPSEIGLNRADGILWFRNAANTGNVAGVLPDNLSWTTSNPTLITQTGTITSATATLNVKKIGKTAFVNVEIVCTTKGTASGAITFALPSGIVPTTNAVLFSVNTTAGTLLFSRVLSGGATFYLFPISYSGSPLADNTTINITGSFQVQ